MKKVICAGLAGCVAICAAGCIAGCVSDEKQRDGKSEKYGFLEFSYEKGSEKYTGYLGGVPAGCESGVSDAVKRLDPDEIKSSKLFLQNPGFSDAEKTGLKKSSEDTYMCFAACASNMLEVTGWGKEAVSDDGTGLELESEDEIFACCKNHFPDEPGDVGEAVRWLVPSAPVEYFQIDDAEKFTDILHFIRNENVLCIAVEFRQKISGTVIERHSLTVFGYMENDFSGMPEILIAADSNDSCAADAAGADNRYRFLYISKQIIKGQSCWIIKNYGSSSDYAIINAVYVLGKNTI